MSVNKYDKDTQTLTKVAGYDKFPHWEGTRAEWNALNKANVQDGTLVSITDDTSEVSFNQNYRTTEIKTGATWIDGKPVYRKVYYHSSKLTFPLSIEDLNVDEVVFMNVKGQNASNAIFLSTVDNCYWEFGQTVVSEDKKQIKRISADNASLYSLQWVIIEYTKTTDTPSISA